MSSSSDILKMVLDRHQDKIDAETMSEYLSFVSFCSLADIYQRLLPEREAETSTVSSAGLQDLLGQVMGGGMRSSETTDKLAPLLASLGKNPDLSSLLAKFGGAKAEKPGIGGLDLGSLLGGLSGKGGATGKKNLASLLPLLGGVGGTGGLGGKGKREGKKRKRDRRKDKGNVNTNALSLEALAPFLGNSDLLANITPLLPLFNGLGGLGNLGGLGGALGGLRGLGGLGGLGSGSGLLLPLLAFFMFFQSQKKNKHSND